MTLNHAPSFYIVGAAKAGTTTLWHWLRAQPDLFLPDTKEPGYFAYADTDPRPLASHFDPHYVMQITTTAQAYDALYEPALGRLSGDASPIYLHHPLAAQRIAQARPEARIIILLRNPVERAHSQFLHHRRDGLEPLTSFAEALRAENPRQSEGWSWGHAYSSHSLYAAAIRRYIHAFPSRQLLFLPFDLLQNDPETLWSRLIAHLGLPPRPLPRMIHANNSSHLPRYPGLARQIRHPGPLQQIAKHLAPAPLRRQLRALLLGQTRPAPGLSPLLRNQLTQHFAADIRQTAMLTGLDLSGWLPASAPVRPLRQPQASF